MVNIQELWRFIGEELNLEIKAKVVVKDLNEEEFEKYWNAVALKSLDRPTQEALKEWQWQAHEGELEAKSDLDYMKKELNGQVFIKSLLRKDFPKSVRLLDEAFPEFKDNDILILIRTNNIPRRQREWTTVENPLTYDDVYNFLIIHEMVDAYSRLSKTKFREGEDMRYDIIASRILHKWRRKEVPIRE